MRAALLAAALAAAGCHGDVCGDGQSCVELVVDTDGTVGQVDQLELRVYGPATFGPGRTTRLSDPTDLPVTTDISIPNGRTGDVTVAVLGLRDGNTVGEGAGTTPIIPGGRVRLTIHVTSKPPRRVFIMPARDGKLGTRSQVDMLCGNAAAAAEMKGNFSALIAYTNIAGPSDFIKLPDGDRQVVRADGSLVATDTTFFDPDHVSNIDQGASGEMNTSDCVWTNFTADGKARGADCGGWTDGSMMRGNYGQVYKHDVNWADFGDNRTCDAKCHVYCIEQ